jgi:hypothetical protein
MRPYLKKKVKKQKDEGMVQVRPSVQSASTTKTNKQINKQKTPKMLMS